MRVRDRKGNNGQDATLCKSPDKMRALQCNAKTTISHIVFQRCDWQSSFRWIVFAGHCVKFLFPTNNLQNSFFMNLAKMHRDLSDKTVLTDSECRRRIKFAQWS